MTRKQLTRRQVIRTGAAGAAGLAVSSLARRAHGLLGANDRIRIGNIGIHGQGQSHIKALGSMEGVEIAYLADVDSRLFGERLKLAEEHGGNKPEVVQDFRRILEDKNLDAVSIATPNHWHSLMTILACQAGKDVYVEKPLSHNVHEGRVAVQAARRYKRIVQHGTQGRSHSGWARVIAAVKSGKLGKLLVARGLCYKTRPSIGFKPYKEPPAGLDFNLWLGPAPEQRYHDNLVHYNWHWFWDTGNGDIGNQGVHQMDIARWGIPGATLPKSVISLGGRFGDEDQGQTPNTQMTVFDYGETQLIFEVRRIRRDKFYETDIGNVFHLEAGKIVQMKFYPKGSQQPAPLPEVDAPLGPGKDKFANFIAAMRSRKPSDLNASVLDGHYSSALCHLANISYRLGKQVPFCPRTKVFDGNKDASWTLARMQEHVAIEASLKLEDLTYRLGRKLVVDAKTESIVNDPEANKMLTRNYREPFVVPEKV